MTSQTDSQEGVSAAAASCLRQIIEAAGLDAEVGIAEGDGVDIALAVSGPDANLLVGPHGNTVDALQYIVTLIVNKNRPSRLRVSVDAAGYRARRAETLRNFANELADEVVSTGQEAVTDPLNPLERRIIHTALAERGDVQTYSEGEEPNRYMVISPKPAE